MRITARRALLLMAALLALLVAVVFGSYRVGYYAALNGASVASASSALLPGRQGGPPADADERFAPFWETWRLVEKEFVNKGAIDAQKMTYGAIRGLLQSLGDEHTTFETPSHARYSEQDMHGTFDGIGVTVSMDTGRFTVVAPMDDSPGAKAGIRARDVIVKIDDRETAGMTMTEAVSLIRGPRGTIVHLTIERPGEAHYLELTVERAAIKMSVVTAELKGDVGYVKIVQFSETTAEQLRVKLTQLLAAKPKALVVDLRNNPGGLLASAVDVASQFISDGVILYQQQRDGPLETFRARRGGVATEVPLYVLVNTGSASASEIVAGAIQDNGRALLVGEHTYGKDSVQNVHLLSDKSSVRITVAKWMTPNKQQIAGKGLTPDVEVAISDDDAKAGRDPQLDSALARARESR